MGVPYAVKRLSRDVSFSASFVVTMALGVSFVMTAFSILNAVALRPVSASEPERLVQVVLSGSEGEYLGVSFPAFDWLRQDHEVAALSAWTGTSVLRVDFGHGTHTFENVIGVSDEYFSTLGVRPALGSFSASNERSEFPATAVLGYASWQSAFGGGDVLGKTILVENTPATVIAVAPRGFRGLAIAEQPGVFLFLSTYLRATGQDAGLFTDRDSGWLGVFGRLRPSISLQTATARYAAMWSANWREIGARRPASEAGLSLAPSRLELKSATRGQDPGIQAKFVGPTAVALGLTLLLFVAQCVSLSALVVTRADRQSRESLIQIALGASLWRVAGLTCLETSMLGVIASAAGWVAHLWLVEVVLAWLSGGHLLPLTLSVSPDIRAGLAVLALLVVVVSSAVAATLWKLRAWRDSGLSRISDRVTVSGTAPQAQLVVLAALAVVLGGQAALIGANASPLNRPDLAGKWKDVTVAYLYGQVAPINASPLSTYNRDLLARVTALPEVTYASATDVIPFSGLAPQRRISTATGSTTVAAVVTVSAGLLSTLGPRIIAGRDFQMSDHGSAPAVAAISQDMADRLFGSAADAIGQVIRIEDLAGRQATVVGVTADAGAFSRKAGRAETVFLPLSQQPQVSAACLIVKGSVTRQALADVVSAQGRDEVIRARSFGELINAEFAREKLLFRIGLSAATFALLVLTVALCAHAFHIVRAGAKETAVRLALGGRPGAIRAGLIKRAAIPVAAGAVIGFGGTWLVRAGITSLVGNDLVLDPWIPFAVVPLLTVLVSVGAVALATGTSTSAEAALRSLRE